MDQDCVSLPASTFRLALQIKTQRYKRFSLQPADEGEQHAEINLCEDPAEADDQPGASSSFRPDPAHQNRLHLCFVVLGLLVFFAIGRIAVLVRNVAQLRFHVRHSKPSSLPLQAASSVMPAAVNLSRRW